MNWSELLNGSRTSTTTRENERSGVRTWHVDTQDTGAANDLFKSSIVDWETFPGDPRFTYDGHDVRLADGASGCIVTARYSTNKGGRAVILKAPPTSAIDWSDQRVECNIPFNARAWYTENDATVVGYWEPVYVNRSRPYPVVVMTVMVRGGTVRQFDAIDEESGNVHVIYGEAFQLVGHTVNRLDENTWRVVYRYLADKGTRRYTLDADFTRFVAPTDRPAVDTYTGVSTAGYFRLPFEQLYFIKSSNPVTTEHGCYSARPTLNADGWRGLPGSQYFDRDSNRVPSLGFGPLP
jgi:hypothetical protein